jgi:hypothetical protein
VPPTSRTRTSSLPKQLDTMEARRLDIMDAQRFDKTKCKVHSPSLLVTMPTANPSPGSSPRPTDLSNDPARRPAMG